MLDIGASRHITGNRTVLQNVRPVSEPVTITFGNGGTGKAAATDEVLLQTPTNVFLLTEVLYIPEASENLISVRHAIRNGLDFRFYATAVTLATTASSWLQHRAPMMPFTTSPAGVKRNRNWHKPHVQPSHQPRRLRSYGTNALGILAMTTWHG